MVASGVVAVLVVIALRQRPGDVTRSRIEEAVAPTFASLVRVQVSLLDAPPVDTASLHAFAQCKKVGAAPKEARGAGDWTCDIGWYVPGRREAVHDTYDLSVTPDGCYTATADATEAHIGGPTVATRSGTPVTNLLYAFDGCFDPSAPTGRR
jgi:hypothetical protein